MKHKKIIFVCTGNTCRSPMAEAALRAELKKRKIRWYTVQSAGLCAEAGGVMNPKSRQALTEAGIPFSETFSSRPLTAAMVKEAFVVICMTEAQRAAVKGGNVTTMQALAGVEIADPYGMDIDAYRFTLRTLRECMPRIIEALHLGEEI